MKKEEKKIVEEKITNEEQKEEERNKKRGLILKVAIFVGCLAVLGGGIITWILVKNNNVSTDKKIVAEVEPTIPAKGNEIVDVPTKAPIEDEVDPVDELDSVVIGPTITLDEKDPNEIGGDEIIEVTPEPTVAPVEPTVAPTPNQGGNNQGGNTGNNSGSNASEPTVAPEPTKTPTATVAPTPTPIVKKDEEYDKAMYDKFIKAGEDFYAEMLTTDASSTYGYKNKKKECLRAIYAFEYIVNNKYLDKETIKKLADEGFFDPKNLIDDYNAFCEIVVREVTDDVFAGAEFVDMHNLCLNAEDKKNAKAIIDLINKFTEGSSKIDKESAMNFIYANEDDKRTVLPITVSEMEEGFEVFYFVSQRVFNRAGYLFGIENNLGQTINFYLFPKSEEIEQSIYNLESIDLSMNKPKVMSI